MHRTGVVIAAGGLGIRMPSRVPKQFLLLKGKQILQHTIQAFDSLRSVHEIVVVVPREYVTKVQRMTTRARFRKVSKVVAGGKERQDSVWNGLNAFTSTPQIVLVHDAVRPCVQRNVINEVILQATHHRAAVVAERVKDTIKVEKPGGFSTETLDRAKLWAVQTPQGFHFELLFRAHKAAQRSGFVGTDDASLVERLGVPVRIVEGDHRNIKITRREDLQLAESWLK